MKLLMNTYLVIADGFNATTKLRLDVPQPSDLYISKSLEAASSFSSKSPAAHTPMSGTSATESPTENRIPKAQTFVWDVKSGREVIEYVHKRPRTDEENNHRRFVRDNGGACDECRKTHRKVRLAHTARVIRSCWLKCVCSATNLNIHKVSFQAWFPILRAVKLVRKSYRGANFVFYLQRRKRETTLKTEGRDRIQEADMSLGPD